MNLITRSVHPTAVAAAALVAAVLLAGVPTRVCAQLLPATAPTADSPSRRTEQDIVTDLQNTAGQMSEALQGTDTLIDPAKRSQVGPKVIPLLRHMNDDLDELAKLQPAAQQAVDAKKQLFIVFLSLFGDKDATNQLATMAANADPVVSVRGQGGQLMVRWLGTSKDPAAQAKVADDMEKLAKAHPTNDELTQQILAMTQMGPANAASVERMQGLVMDVMKSPTADQVRPEIDAARKLKSLEGHPLAVAGKTPEGKDFSTADWKGKVVLVDFWATWCGPCIQELPRVKKVYSDYHGKGLEVLGVSNDFAADDLKKFLAENKDMPWPQLFDASAAAQQQWNPVTLAYGINGIPTMFLIDKKGVVRSVSARENMEELIPKMLAE
jgi:thiol-disulfide isomerase/thioredoxin